MQDKDKQISFASKVWRFYNSWTGSIIFVLFVIFFIAQAFTIPSGSMKNTLLIGDHLVVKKFSYGILRPYLPFAEVPLLPDFNKNGHLISAQGPKRGDIVVFRSVENEQIHYIKRCVAEPNDEVVYANKHLFVRMHEGDEYMRANYSADDLELLGGKLFVKEPFKQPGVHYDKRVDFEKYVQNAMQRNKFAMSPAYFAELDEFFKTNEYQAYYFKVPADEYFMMGDNRDHSNDSRFWGSVPYKNIEGKPWFIYLSWDEDYRIRWDRMFKFIDSLENDVDLLPDNLDDMEAFS